MKKKILCAAIIVMMVVACTPTVTAYTSPPEGCTCWVATDGVVEPVTKQTHNFYDEYAASLEDFHTQEWYYYPLGLESPEPIKNDGYYMNTTITCSAVSSNNQSILTVKTSETNGDYHIDEWVKWTVINGNKATAGYNVTIEWQLQDEPYEMSTDVEIDGEPETLELGYLQALEMTLKYDDDDDCPGQKYYWIETDLGVGQPDKNETWNVFTSGNWFSCGQITSTDHNLTWWTDWDQGEYQGMRQIYLEDWHQNTKALAWVEDTGASLTLYLEVYGQATMPYLRERINWTINNGDKSGAYFNVYINSDDIPQSWTSPNLYPGAGAEFEEIGSLDNLTVDLYYMDPC